MFIDEAQINVRAGNGGDGKVSFRREKFIAKGGPDGGDGGRGGSVIFRADPNVNTLLDFSGRHHWHAENGQGGGPKNMYGKSAKDLVIPVPAGTIVRDLDMDLTIADLTEVDEEVVICKGGKGGRGNWHFKSSTHQAPAEAEPGVKGEERNLRLELKLIADVGLVGLPNAGKSTLLSAVSAARPKIAPYPFTTLDPQLGIAELSGFRRIVLADIPGLIENASQGAGLGVAFLKHIERTRVIVHMLDIVPDNGLPPIENYRTIRKELEAFSPELADKPELIVANKVDLLLEEFETVDELRAQLPDRTVLATSGATKDGTTELLQTIWELLHPAD